MMAMALPIAIVGVIGSPKRGRQILYGLAIAALIAGMFATQRKSALIVPVAVIATLAYFRRRELLSLAPLGLVIAVMAAAASPGRRPRRGRRSSPGRTPPRWRRRATAPPTTTPSARTCGAHLLFGRGYGTYNHDTYRILDSEILNRVDRGRGARASPPSCSSGSRWSSCPARTIAERDPRWAPGALCGTAAAVAFITVSTLFDVTAVPHGTDTFLYMAGLAAVVATPTRRPASAVARRGIRRARGGRWVRRGSAGRTRPASRRPRAMTEVRDGAGALI